jgi:hypothetical protein
LDILDPGVAGATIPNKGEIIFNKYYLVGGFNHLENIRQWEELSHIFWKIKICLKPPTSYTYFSSALQNPQIRT